MKKLRSWLGANVMTGTRDQLDLLKKTYNMVAKREGKEKIQKRDAPRILSDLLKETFKARQGTLSREMKEQQDSLLTILLGSDTTNEFTLSIAASACGVEPRFLKKRYEEARLRAKKNAEAKAGEQVCLRCCNTRDLRTQRVH